MDDANVRGAHPDSILIDELGGTVATAKLCEVTPQAVTHWRTTGIPRARLMFLRLRRPDLFEGREDEPADAPEPNAWPLQAEQEARDAA